jgi:hypothetical protein
MGYYWRRGGLDLFSAAAVKQAIDMADNMKTLEARVKNATKATGDFKTVNEQLLSDLSEATVRRSRTASACFSHCRARRANFVRPAPTC